MVPFEKSSKILQQIKYQLRNLRKFGNFVNLAPSNPLNPPPPQLNLLSPIVEGVAPPLYVTDCCPQNIKLFYYQNFYFTEIWDFNSIKKQTKLMNDKLATEYKNSSRVQNL